MTGADAFRITPDLRFLYPQQAHEAGFNALVSMLRQNGSVALVHGEAGTGKTMLLRRLESALRSGAARPLYVPIPELFRDALLAQKNARPGTRSGIILLDDADNCPDDVLARIQDLVTQPQRGPDTLRLVLAGGPFFWPRLLRERPALAESVTTRVELPAFDTDDVAAYIRHRLAVAGRPTDVFAAEAVAAIAHHSRGVPRLVNQICSRALILASLDMTASVSLKTIADVVEDWPAEAFSRRLALSDVPRPPAPERLPSPAGDTAAVLATTPEASPSSEPAEPDMPAAEGPAEPVDTPALPGGTTDSLPVGRDIAALREPVDGAGDADVPSAPPTRMDRRKGRRLKIKPVSSEVQSPPDIASPQSAEGPPPFSGFVARRNANPAPVRESQPVGELSNTPQPFSGFVPRRPSRATPLAPVGPDDEGVGTRHRRRILLALASAIGVALAAFFVHRFSRAGNGDAAAVTYEYLLSLADKAGAAWSVLIELLRTAGT